MGSKSHLKRGFQKNIEKMMIFSTPTPLWIELWLQRELDFHFLIRCVFGTLLGLILEVFWEAKWRPRPSKSHFKKTSKNDTQNEPKLVPKGAQNGPKTAQNEVLEASCFKAGSQGASRHHQDHFWRGFGTTLGSFFALFRMHVGWFLHALVSNRLQTEMFNFTM